MHESPSTSSRTPAKLEPEFVSLEQVSRYLEGLINRESRVDYVYERLDLRPIRALLDGVGRPERGLSIIHVAGSKGKGSTCLFAEALLLALGEHVGTFTSPHLESWVERFRIDGEPIDEVRLVAAVNRVRPVVEALRVGPTDTRPSFFDATTAVALLLFEEAGVDRALMEVGLGGRLDSTNVVDPVVTCITSIELEHTDKLGETEAEIAGEKAGILKWGIPVVVGRLRCEAAGVIRARAEELSAPMIEVGGEIGSAHDPEQDPNGIDLDFELVTPGRAARLNAALAVECVRALAVYEPAVLADAATRSLSLCRLPARIEVLAKDPAVIVDAAHTAESARALADALIDLAPKGYDLLLSVSSDKNLEALLEPLLPRARRVWTTRAEPLRSLDAEVLAEGVASKARSLGLSIVVESEPDPARAAVRARYALAPDGHLCAAGSVYLAGLARRILGSGDTLPETRRAIMNEIEIGLAAENEVAAIPEIERRASLLFAPEDLPPAIAARTTSRDDYARAQHEGRLIVARDPGGAVVGFAHLEILDGRAHLEELDVDPAFGRRGIGGRLVAAACGWARERRFDSISLTTFREIPWNAPFYTRLGFVVLSPESLTDALRALRESERGVGLDVERRVIMLRRLVGADLEFAPR